MEKSILTLLIALIITALTSLKILTSYGAVSLVHSCFDALLWLIQKSYFNKEKDLTHDPSKIK